MNLKEITVTEVISILSFLGLGISIGTQTFLFYRLDSLWIMSLISPTIYLIDIVKVITSLLIMLMTVLFLESLYKKITKKFRTNKKIIFRQDENISTLLKKNRLKFELSFYFFIFLFIIIFCFVITLLKVKTTIIFFLIFGAFAGLILILVIDKSLKRKDRLFITILLLFIGSIALGEYKFISTPNLPVLVFNQNNQLNYDYKLLEINKTNAIIFKRNKNGSNSFKIIDLNQIHSIQSNR